MTIYVDPASFMWGVAAGILLLLFIALLGVSKDRDGK